MAEQNETPQGEQTKETILRHVHDEIARVIHAIESGAHNGLEHLRVLKERIAQHL